MSDLTTSASHQAAKAGEKVDPTAHRVGKAVDENPAYRTFVTVGLLAFALVHVLIALISLRIAWGGGGQEASTSGAFQTLVQQPGGSILLGVCAAGLAALVLWQMIEATIGNARFQGSRRLLKRLASAGRALIYGALAFTAARVVVSGAQSGGEEQQEGLVARVLQLPGGQILVGIVGLIVVAVGIYHAARGIRRSFKEDLQGSVPTWLTAIGTYGYAAKGFAVTVLGGLFLWSAFTFNPEAAGNTNSALRTLVNQPFGPYILTAVAAGLILFAAYSAVWAFNARHDTEESTRPRRAQ